MKIRRVEFLRSAVTREDFPSDHLPEVAFAGRSNVGKSSLLNTLWGRKGMARTSSTPGRTRTINFYLLEGAYYFVDLPGYGFAKVPLKMRRMWRRMMETYFHCRGNLRGVVLIMDARIGPTELDRQMLEWLEALELKAIPVLTKADKASQRELAQAKAALRPLGIHPEEAIIFSAKTGQGKAHLWAKIDKLLQTKAT